MDRQPATAPSVPDEGEVRQALERLTARPPLSRSDRLSRFLRYIVEEALAGRADVISGYSIAVDVFNKPEDFDPTIDSIVRVEAGRLRQRLSEYYYEAGRDDPVEISLPRGRYAPAFKSRQIDARPASAAAELPHHGPSIAVLPFRSYGTTSTDQDFVDGLTEETTVNLARFKDLLVFSRSTTAKLVRDGADIRQLRSELGVDFVVECSVRKTSDKVRVAAQLIDAESGGLILAERIERPCTPDGVFDIQDKIAQLVAGRIADRYGLLGRYLARASRSGRSKRWETYLWTVRFYRYYATHDPALHLEVREGLEQALVSDPDSSDATAALAAIYLDEYRLHLNARSGFPALDRALEAALRGVTCDPDNAMAYQFLALTYYHRGELVDFDISAQRAIELNPGHPDVLADIGHCYALAGEWEQGLPLIGRAMEISPVHPGWYHHAPALKRLLDGDPEIALRELKSIPMQGFYWYHALLACIFALAGRNAEAADEVEALLRIAPDFSEKAQSECRIWTANQALIEKLSEGWREAGLAAT